jgi:hypothetical protein
MRGHRPLPVDRLELGVIAILVVCLLTLAVLIWLLA